MTMLDDLHRQHQERLVRLGSAQAQVPSSVKEDVLRLSIENSSLREEVSVLRTEMEAIKRQTKIHNDLLGKVIITTEDEEKPQFNEIIDAVCEYYNVTKNDILSSRRTGDLIIPRQVICYLGRSLTGMSFPQMGRRLGGRDHTTALHAANKIHRLVANDEILADDISVLEIKIGAKVMQRRFGPNVAPLS